MDAPSIYRVRFIESPRYAINVSVPSVDLAEFFADEIRKRGRAVGACSQHLDRCSQLALAGRRGQELAGTEVRRAERAAERRLHVQELKTGMGCQARRCREPRRRRHADGRVQRRARTDPRRQAQRG